MANLTGLASIVSELRAVRTNLANQLKHVDAALSVLLKTQHPDWPNTNAAGFVKSVYAELQ